MAGNQSLNKAAIAKQDEFYTQLSDVEEELRHYRQHFEGKTVLCNCDDPFESNFFKYFVLNFNRLGLKKLVATGYAGSPVAGTQLNLFEEESGGDQAADKPYKATVTSVRDITGNGALDMDDIAELMKCGEIDVEQLEGDGDFRSQECLNLLDEVDIVVTNPPFSLFREYLTTLVRSGKGFLIIGNQNAITYKEIFPLLMSNQVWLGYKFGDMSFRVPDYYEPRETRYWQDESGQKWRSMGNVCWYTNLDIKKRHEELILVPRYDPEKYPKYDNYDAIEVSKVADIPCDYEPGYLVPIEYKQQLLDAEEFVLGSERKNSKGQMCVCVCGYASSSAFTDNATSSSDGVLQRTDGSADHLSGEVQPGAIRNSGNYGPTEHIRAANQEIHSGGFTEVQRSECKERLKEERRQLQTGLCAHINSSEDFEWCNGVMGVPITFFDSYSPEQFVILGETSGRNDFDPLAWPSKRYVNALQHNQDGSTSNGGKVNTGAQMLKVAVPTHGVYYTADNADGCLVRVYKRILVQRRINND